MMAISSGLSLAIYWIGAYIIIDAKFDRSSTTLCRCGLPNVSMQVMMGFLLMEHSSSFFLVPWFRRRINQYWLHSSIENPSQAQTANLRVQGQVEFRDVTFRYSKNSEAVVEHVTFKAVGQTVAFIGSTGFQVSPPGQPLATFLRFRDGNLVDGVNVQDYDLEDLRNKVNIFHKKSCALLWRCQGNRLGKSRKLPSNAEAAMASSRIGPV